MTVFPTHPHPIRRKYRLPPRHLFDRALQKIAFVHINDRHLTLHLCHVLWVDTAVDDGTRVRRLVFDQTSGELFGVGAGFGADAVGGRPQERQVGVSGTQHSELFRHNTRPTYRPVHQIAHRLEPDAVQTRFTGRSLVALLRSQRVQYALRLVDRVVRTGVGRFEQLAVFARGHALVTGSVPAVAALVVLRLGTE